MRIQSPAKLNLFLDIREKRQDGYHNLHTLFERVGLYDDIELTTIKSGIEIEMVGAHGRAPLRIPVEKNLCYRAAALLKEKYGVDKGVRIRLTKRIPAGAGLGGGSSNAASVLMGLSKLWKLKLKQPELLKLAALLGSDCAFFVLESPFAEATGRGEKLKAVRGPAQKLWHVLVKPSFSIPTPGAYQALDKLKKRPQLTPKRVDVRMLVRSLQNNDSACLSRLCRNSFELVLNKRLRAISEIKARMKKSGALTALMSGSGSCVFGLYRNQKEAMTAAKALKGKGQVFVVSTD